MFIFTFQLPDLKKHMTTVMLLLFCSVLLFAEGKNESTLALTCPEDLIVTPDPGECFATLDFNSLQWSSTQNVTNPVFTPGPGTNFPYGTTVINLTVTTSTGAMESCNFTVFVEQFSNQLICGGNIFVYIEDVDCQQELTADMVLLGGPYACNESYTTSIFSPSGDDLGNIVTIDMIGTTYSIQVEDNETNEICFGSIIPRADSLPQFIACPPDATILCHEPIDPIWTGHPDYETCFEESEVVIDYTDERENSYCDGDDISFNIVRTWTVTNPFGGESSCQHKIKAKRILFTDIVFPPDFDGTDMPPFICSETLTPSEIADTSITGIPLVNGLDPHSLACNLSVTYTDSIRNVCGNAYEIMRYWYVLDYCNNFDVDHTQLINIIDSFPPAFSIPDTILASVQIPCSIVANMPPIDSVDECSPFDVTIETPWGDIMGNGGEILIPLEEGIHPVTYHVEDGCGNDSTLNSVVQIQDDVVALCPPTAYTNSEHYLANIEPELNVGNYDILLEFGYPEFAINCEFNFVESVLIDIGDCDEGAVWRIFDVAQSSSESCAQLIEVHHVSDFVVQFPADTIISCGTDPLNLAEPNVLNAESEDIEISFEDEVITTSPDFCYVIERTWMVKNNCVTGNADDNEVIEVPESLLGLPFPECDLDGDGDCDSLTFRDSWTDVDMPNQNQAPEQFGPDTDPDSDPWDGYIAYTQLIYVNDTIAPAFVNCDTLPNVCLTGSGCAGEVTLPIPEMNDCSDIIMSAQVSFNGPTQTGFGPYQNIEPGTYEVTYTVQDVCDNEAICETTVTVVDCTPPTPNCQPQTTLTIEPGTPPSVGIFAADLNNGSVDNCPGGLQFSFSPDEDDFGRVFFCDDIGLQTLQLYVTDIAGNQDSCEVTLIIQEPSPGFCTGTPGMTISGNIYMENIEGIDGAIIGSSQGYAAVTNTNGEYVIGYDNTGTSLELTPSLNSDPLNGVTTFDALLIVKHVLGNGLLNSPYKIIAGDVNGSNSVTTFDALMIRQLILNVISEFPAGSWRFVPADFNFPDPTMPFDSFFPEFAQMDIPPTTLGPNFIGMKIGDVNVSADPMFSNVVDDRQAPKHVSFSFSDFYVNNNESISVPIFMPKEAIQGFQFALGFDFEKLELISIEPGFIDEAAFGKNELHKGILKTSWYTALPVKNKRNLPTFTLRFSPKAEGLLSEMIWLEEGILRAEAYSPQLELMEVNLVYVPQNMEKKSFVLHPNRPDPFSESTVIPFEMPTAGILEFHLFDATGKMVQKVQSHFAEGYHELEIRADNLPGTGVYFYKITTENGTAEGKMIRR